VEGNGESIYYALQEEEVEKDSTKYLVTFTTGMNKMICSNMRINFVKGKINNVTAYVMPDASFIPPLEIKEADRKLKGFVWKGEYRPARADVVKNSAVTTPSIKKL
jgi:hypothetical protein